MKTPLVITDLTRMQRGKVCIAGYDKAHTAIRPVLPPPGIPESLLCLDGQPVIYPFALVEFDLLDPIPQPPHSEDVSFAAETIRLIRVVHSREEVLRWSLYESVGTIFDQPIQRGPGHYVLDCTGSRSLGTIQPQAILDVLYEPGEDEGVWSYRLAFIDNHDELYRLKITDLTWNYYCASLRGEDDDPAQIAARLTQVLCSGKVYLRIGLSRGWKKFPGRCYLQINAIYTFPDYLEGKTFADFAAPHYALG
jgi:hypothetical protein